ncbi:unnamed protein product [Chilo suppressalis]|uniref:IRS-type PTB domain-containing protein n=1 Tax=Chilo suppressalis TaxID=168631 RepID=A0ABN8BGZ2_CHISP|nr:hypothetical protein evm_013848 [Chilo suppressalis]CAH0406986.1 unnamed protein product [Chilo suppressalis]
MGCFHSKKESSDIHPSIYRVINIDENGAELCSGQLEITESDIILYREGRDSTIWPLHSLRRYGFEGEIFSFESGRRCETGAGIYAFRCRRASLLFHTLQQQIQLRNAIHDSVSYPVSHMTPSPQGRQTLQASVVHRSSIDNGQPESSTRSTFSNNNANITSNIGVPRPVTQTTRFSSSADILEVMPLYPRSQANGNHVTNLYQVRDFKREHNNNQAETPTGVDVHHVYSNDLTRDLAILRNTLRQETALNTMRDIEDETRFLEGRYLNENVPNKNNPVANPLSPTLSNNSEHYAQLSIEQQEAARLYVNVTPNETNTHDKSKTEPVPPTPLTPKQVEYCNLPVGMKPEMNSYANLTLGDIGDSVKNGKLILHFNTTSDKQKFSESDTMTSISPVEETEVNYAILDIDCNKDTIKSTKESISSEGQSNSSSRNESTASCTSQPRGRLISQSSVDKATTGTISIPLAAIGYTTIDFDKTVALTSVAAGNEAEMENSRRTRHSSCNILLTGSANFDKGKLCNY